MLIFKCDVWFRSAEQIFMAQIMYPRASYNHASTYVWLICSIAVLMSFFGQTFLYGN